MSCARRTTTTRSGTPSDLAVVTRLMQASFDPQFGEAWTSAQCLGMLALPGAWLTLAEHDGIAIGFALSRATLDEGELLLIAIEPPARGHGSGRALLRAVIADARDRGVRDFHLEVRAGNPAIALYQSEGFEKSGERRDYYRGRNNELFDAHSFRREI